MQVDIISGSGVPHTVTVRPAASAALSPPMSRYVLSPAASSTHPGSTPSDTVPRSDTSEADGAGTPAAGDGAADDGGTIEGGGAVTGCDESVDAHPPSAAT